LSFFDEVDEPPQRPPRTESRSPRPSGRGRPPGDQQAIQTRRAVALVGIVVVIVLAAVGIHSCDDSAHTSALRNYTSSVYTIVESSNALGPAQLFADLSGGDSSCSGATNLYQCIAALADKASAQLQQSKALSVPGGMQSAQRDLVETMRLRHDGFDQIADNVQSAFVSSSAAQAVSQIAVGISQLYASDVIYKTYAAPEIAAALNADGIRATAEPFASGQLVSNLDCLDQTFIAQTMGAKVPGVAPLAAPTIGPGLVAVGTNTMVTGATNHVVAKPPPTFTIPVTNSGASTDYGITCSITVATGQSGSATIPELAAHGQTTCSVTLTSSPPVATNGTPVDVTARVTVGTKSNSTVFPVDFLASG